MKVGMKQLAMLGLLGALVCGCNEKKEEKKKEIAVAEQPVAPQPAAVQPAAVQPAGAQKAPEVAHKVKKAYAIVDQLAGSDVVGSVIFTTVEGGVRVVADIGGLKPGLHGFHVHENGQCSADGASAGAHYNPFHKKHGGPDSEERHVGDLGNIEANDGGFAHYDRVDKVISLDGPYSIVGRSIIIHADPDDLTTDPSGNSGKRIACGVIVLAE